MAFFPKNILLPLVSFLFISGVSQAQGMPFKALGPIQLGESLDDALNTPHDIGDHGASLEDGSVVLYTDINNQHVRIDALPSNGIILSVFVSFFPKIKDDTNCQNKIDTFTENLKNNYNGKVISTHMEDFDVIPFSDKQYKGLSNSIMVSDHEFINLIERKYNDLYCKLTVSFEKH